MKKEMVVITGATGRVGGRLAEILLDNNFRVKVVSRDLLKLSRLMAAGAEPVVAALTDSKKLTNAFSGAEAVFVLTPLNLLSEHLNNEQKQNIAGLVQAIRDSGVRNVILLSSWGAELTQGLGGILGCRIFEQELDGIAGLNTVILRPVWFMENFLFNIDLIKMAGINGMAMDPKVRFPMISTADIAAVAASYLTDKSFQGKNVLYLKGDAEYNMAEVTAILGRSIGNERLKYVEFPQAVLKKGMTDSGQLSPDGADMFIIINEGISSGRIRIPAGEELITTPTTIYNFAEKQFAPAYHNAAKPGFGKKLTGWFLRSFLSIAGPGMLKKQNAIRN